MNVDGLIANAQEKSPILLGLDPNFDQLPESLRPSSAEPESVTEALHIFAKLCIEACADKVAGIKIQSAFYEQYGLAGSQAIAQTIRLAREHNLYVLMDAKRGDIGSTSAAYARAYLNDQIVAGNHRSANPLSCDALVVNPYLGDDSLQPYIEEALRSNAGLFVLVRTSNPGAPFIQDAMDDGNSVSSKVANWLSEQNKSHQGSFGYGPFGAVVGATIPPALAKTLRKALAHSLILAPGIGAQGGDFESAIQNFCTDGIGALFPISRGLTVFPDKQQSEGDYKTAVSEAASQYFDAYQSAARK